MLPIPIGTDRPQRRVPWMNILIIAANVVIYMLSHQTERVGIYVKPPTSSGLTEWWDQGILNAHKPQLFQFFSYQFLHKDLMHILGNMLFLYVFGNNLNEKLGHLSYLVFYLAGGVLAGCGQLLTDNVSTLGASGSISAVTGMYLALLPRTNIRIWVWWFFYVGVFEIPSIYFILLSVAKDFLEPYLFGGRNNVAHLAHISGTIAGFAIGMTMLWTRLVQRDHYDILAMINRWRRRKAYESMVAQGAEFYTGPNKGDGTISSRMRNETPTDPRIYDMREKVFAAIRERDTLTAAAAYLELCKQDGAQILPEDVQIDVANQLMAEGKHPEAAEAYEKFLGAYPRVSRVPQVQLMLGVIYARYVPNHARAAELLKAASGKLINPAEKQLAEAELAHIATSAGGSGIG